MKPALGCESLKCCLCKMIYHHQCINMTSARYRELIKTSWRCHSCDNITQRASRRPKGDETPTRRQHEEPIPPAPASSAKPKSTDDVIGSPSTPGTITYEKFEMLLDAKLNQFKTTITSEFNLIVEKLQETYQAELECLRNENSKLKEKFALLEKKVSCSNTAQMGETIINLQNQLNERDQELLTNDVEITGIPEYKSETVVHLVMTAASKMGTVIDERDIVSAFRVGPISEPVDVGPPRRPRPIVVRLMRRSLRDELLKNARVRRGVITTAELGLPEHVAQRFFINERLTKNNRALFAKARDASREANWKYVWTMDGRVYARQDKASQRYSLRSEADLKIFGLV